jgi:tetratricopeptide (TPR) repeat protein
LLFRLADLELDHAQVARARTLAQRLDEMVVDADDADEVETLGLEVLHGRVALESAEAVDPAAFGAVADRLVSLARAAGDGDALGVGLRALCMSGAMRGRWRPVYDAATELVTSPAVRGAARAHTFREASAIWGPVPVREALELCRSAPPDPSATLARVTSAQFVLVALLAYDGEIEAARELAARARAAIPSPESYGVVTAAFFESRLQRAAGDRDDAIANLAAGAAVCVALDSLSFASTLLAEQATVLLELGRFDEARAALNQAESFTSPFDAISQSVSRGCRAVLAAHEGRFDEAVRFAEEALQYVDGTDQVVEQGNVRRQLATAARARGDLATERNLLIEARDRYAAKGVRPYLAATEDQLRQLDASSAG